MDSTTFNSEVGSGTFSVATFNATVSKISDCLPDFNTKVEEVASAVAQLLTNPLIRGWIADKVNWAMQKIREAVTALFNKVTELLQGYVAPLLMFSREQSWSHDVYAPMQDLKVAVAEDQLIDQDSWDGEGYRAYKKAVKDQSEAAESVGNIGNSMHNNLSNCAIAGGVFYVAVLGVVIDTVVELTAAAGVSATGAGAPVGLAGTALSLGKALGLLVALVGAVGAFLFAQQQFINNMLNALDSFPGNQWPNATKG